MNYSARTHLYFLSVGDLKYLCVLLSRAALCNLPCMGSRDASTAQSIFLFLSSRIYAEEGK